MLNIKQRDVHLTIFEEHMFLIFKPRSTFFYLMLVIKYVTVLSDKYPMNFTRIPDRAGCLYFTGYQMVLSGYGTSLADMQRE